MISLIDFGTQVFEFEFQIQNVDPNSSEKAYPDDKIPQGDNSQLQQSVYSEHIWLLVSIDSLTNPYPKQVSSLTIYFKKGNKRNTPNTNCKKAAQKPNT